MANLIPDVTGSLRINTTSAMSDYQNAMKNIRDAVASPGALIDKYLEREEKERRAAEEQKRYETDLGFKQRQEGRVVDELNRAQATREAVQAQLNPDMYRNSKLTEVDNAIQQGLANLSPQERAVAEQEIARNYNRDASGNYVLDSARANVLADPTTVLGAQANQLNLRLKDPNSAEFKAAQQAEWDAAKRKMDYSHGQAVSLQNLKNSYDLNRDRIGANEAANLLNVGTTYNAVTGTNADAIAAIKKANETISNKQGAYGDAYVEAYNKNPNARPEDIDAEARKAIGIRNMYTPLDKLIPLSNVPEYEERTKVSQKSLDMYTKDLLDEARRTGSLNSNTLKLIDSQTRAYESALKGNAEKAKESMTLDDLKGVIKDLKGDPSTVSTKEGAKQYIDALEAKMKAGSKNKPGGTLGVGPLTTDAANKTGIKDWFGSEWENVKAKAAGKYVSDKELADIINTANQNHTFWWTNTSTQEEDILEMLDQYPDRK